MAETKNNSAEAVAFELLLTIAKAEGVHLDNEKGGWSKEQILATYRECLAAVRGGGASAATPLRPVGQELRQIAHSLEADADQLLEPPR